MSPHRALRVSRRRLTYLYPSRWDFAPVEVSEEIVPMGKAGRLGEQRGIFRSDPARESSHPLAGPPTLTQ